MSATRRPTKGSPMIRTIAAFTLAAATVVGLAFLAPESVPSALPPFVGISLVNDQPEEDEAGWDCHTMGNRVCGAGHTG